MSFSPIKILREPAQSGAFQISIGEDKHGPGIDHVPTTPAAPGVAYGANSYATPMPSYAPSASSPIVADNTPAGAPITNTTTTPAGQAANSPSVGGPWWGDGTNKLSQDPLDVNKMNNIPPGTALFNWTPEMLAAIPEPPGGWAASGNTIAGLGAPGAPPTVYNQPAYGQGVGGQTIAQATGAYPPPGG